MQSVREVVHFRMLLMTRVTHNSQAVVNPQIHPVHYAYVTGTMKELVTKCNGEVVQGPALGPQVHNLLIVNTTVRQGVKEFVNFPLVTVQMGTGRKKLSIQA